MKGSVVIQSIHFGRGNCSVPQKPSEVKAALSCVDFATRNSSEVCNYEVNEMNALRDVLPYEPTEISENYRAARVRPNHVVCGDVYAFMTETARLLITVVTIDMIE